MSYNDENNSAGYDTAISQPPIRFETPLRIRTGQVSDCLNPGSLSGLTLREIKIDLAKKLAELTPEEQEKIKKAMASRDQDELAKQVNNILEETSVEEKTGFGKFWAEYKSYVIGAGVSLIVLTIVKKYI